MQRRQPDGVAVLYHFFSVQVPLQIRKFIQAGQKPLWRAFFNRKRVPVQKDQNRSLLDPSGLCLGPDRQFRLNAKLSGLTKPGQGTLRTFRLTDRHTDNGSQTPAFIISSSRAISLAATRRTFPSTAGFGIPNAKEPTAPAV